MLWPMLRSSIMSFNGPYNLLCSLCDTMATGSKEQKKEKEIWLKAAEDWKTGQLGV